MNERRALSIALSLNMALAAVEIASGFLTRSVALLADAADFVEDSAVYLLALLMRDATGVAERRFGLVVAGLMALPGAAALWQVDARLADPAPPDGTTIWAVSGLALAANLASSAVILAARRGPEPTSLGLRAAWLSSRNDALANLAMISAGFMVAATGQGWPDILVGIGVGVLHLSGGVAILRSSLRSAAE